MNTDPDMQELLAMADMYVSKCTRQEEKFRGFQRLGVAWRWEDCKAAYALIMERADWYELVSAWKSSKQSKQQS